MGQQDRDSLVQAIEKLSMAYILNDARRDRHVLGYGWPVGWFTT